jgi:hypothetical protein
MAVSTLLFVGMAIPAEPLSLWLFLSLLSVASFGFGTAFPTATVTIQNAVARHQIGTATGAANFFRSLTAAFTVAGFTTILLAVLGVKLSMSGHNVDFAAGLPAGDTYAAFRAIFLAAAALMAIGCVAIILMEERPLAGPAARAKEGGA